VPCRISKGGDVQRRASRVFASPEVFASLRKPARRIGGYGEWGDSLCNCRELADKADGGAHECPEH
jgi:hypothetical protein